MTMPNVRIVTVTPEIARQWLQHNIGNRSLSRASVVGYKDSLLRGEWRLSGDAIMFNRRGELINGQHRLTAVAETNTSAPFLVMENCEESTKDIIDLGRSRSVPDMLRMIYGVDRASMVTSVFALLDRAVYGRPLKLTVDRALEQIEVYDRPLRWATSNMPGKNIFVAAPIVAACVFAYNRGPALVDEFAARLCKGHDLSAGSPILLLRNTITRIGGIATRSEDRIALFFLCLTAIYKHLHDERARSLRQLDAEFLVDYFGPPNGVQRPARTETEAAR